MHSDFSDILPGSLLSFFSGQHTWILCLVVSKTLMTYGSSDDTRNWEIITIFVPSAPYEKFIEVILFKNDRNFLWNALS